MSGKELRHFKISNKNPSATLKQMVGLKGLEGDGSRCSIWEQGTASGKAEWMNRQKQQQAGDMTGEGHFLPSFPQERRCHITCAVTSQG